MIYVVIDIGCHECGVDSEVVAAYKTRRAAEKAAERRDAENGGWREGGRTIATVFEVPLP